MEYEDKNRLTSNQGVSIRAIMSSCLQENVSFVEKYDRLPNCGILEDCPKLSLEAPRPRQ